MVNYNKGGERLELYVWNSDFSSKTPAEVSPAVSDDLAQTADWQTQWTSEAVSAMPNKVALHRADNGELLGLMSYELNQAGLAVELIYLESAAHSNAHLLAQTGERKRYHGIAKALFAYAAWVSQEAGFGGVIFFKAKTTRLREYYIQQFGAMPLGHYDPFRLIIWEDAAQRLIAEFCEETDTHD